MTISCTVYINALNLHMIKDYKIKIISFCHKHCRLLWTILNGLVCYTVHMMCSSSSSSLYKGDICSFSVSPTCHSLLLIYWQFCEVLGCLLAKVFPKLFYWNLSSKLWSFQSVSHMLFFFKLNSYLCSSSS